MEQDALNGLRVRQFLAVIYGWTGEKALAGAPAVEVVAPSTATLAMMAFVVAVALAARDWVVQVTGLVAAVCVAALAIGDALAMTLLVEKGFRQEDFANLHPGGKLGKRLMRVEALMHAGKQCPVVRADTRMQDVIYEMSSKQLGMTCVIDGDDDTLLGPDKRISPANLAAMDRLPERRRRAKMPPRIRREGRVCPSVW